MKEQMLQRMQESRKQGEQEKMKKQRKEEAEKSAKKEGRRNEIPTHKERRGDSRDQGRQGADDTIKTKEDEKSKAFKGL